MRVTRNTACRLYRDMALAAAEYDPDMSPLARLTLRRIVDDYCRDCPTDSREDWLEATRDGMPTDVEMPMGEAFEAWFDRNYHSYHDELLAILQEPPPLDHDVPIERFEARTPQQRETYLRGRRKYARRAIHQLRSTDPEYLLAHAVLDAGQRALVEASLNSIATHKAAIARYDAELGDSLGD